MLLIYLIVPALRPLSRAQCVIAMLLSDNNVQLMHCVVLSNGLYNIDVNCYNVRKFYAS